MTSPYPFTKEEKEAILSSKFLHESIWADPEEGL